MIKVCFFALFMLFNGDWGKSEGVAGRAFVTNSEVIGLAS